MEVNESNFKEFTGVKDRLVVLDFWAEWCGPCRMLAPLVDQLAEEKAGQLTVYSVDVDVCPDVAGAFGVSAVPTLILFEDGKPLRQTMGAQPIERLREFVEA